MSQTQNHPASNRLAVAHARVQDALARIHTAREVLEERTQEAANSRPTLPTSVFASIEASIAKVEKVLADWPHDSKPEQEVV